MAQSIYEYMMSMLTPNEASAEVIPQTPGAATLLKQGLADPGQGGDVVRALHARPEKVYMTDKPDFGMRWADVGTVGRFRPQMWGPDYQLSLNMPLMEALGGKGHPEILRTMEHEMGHGLAQVTGVGGLKRPTGIGAIDAMAGLRVPKATNEAIADQLIGLHQLGQPSIAEALTRDVWSKLGQQSAKK